MQTVRIVKKTMHLEASTGLWRTTPKNMQWKLQLMICPIKGAETSGEKSKLNLTLEKIEIYVV